MTGDTICNTLDCIPASDWLLFTLAIGILIWFMWWSGCAFKKASEDAAKIRGRYDNQ